jgi:hypothetical protein
MIEHVASAAGDFRLSMDELRVVTRFVTASAEEVLPVFEKAVSDDDRPFLAIEAARAFINGARRSKLQRVASLNAHRAAAQARTEVVRLAARCAGDAAAAPYLHPIARGSQVGHILRASATAARIAELESGGSAAVGDRAIERVRQSATPTLIDVLRRYPPPPTADNRVAHLMTTLDAALRELTEAAEALHGPDR